MLSSTRHSVRRARLKSFPILAVLTFADSVDGIEFRVAVIVGRCAKFTGSVIEGANSPDHPLLRKARDTGHPKHQQQPCFAHSFTQRFTNNEESHQAFTTSNFTTSVDR